MSTFTPQTTVTAIAPLDPFKHVNYTLGMVLGVDELSQDFVYGRERDASIIRELIGYGTVCGLAVRADEGGAQPQVLVESGTAVSPRGQFIRVPSAQCARLNDWLAANATKVGQYRSANDIRLYVVVRYAECFTDKQPIPGEPCRSEDDMMADSRVQDDYRLELLFEPPDQRHDYAIRDFILWLRQIEVADVPDDPARLAAFEDALRQAVPQLGSPPTSPPTSPPDYMIGSPPESVVIPREATCDYLRRAFLLWTTELRPLWLGVNQSCAGDPPDEENVLLAELTVALTPAPAGQVANAPAIIVNEEDRPYLISLRMLQEALLCGLPGLGGAALDAADTVVTEMTFGQAQNPGVAPEYSRADHTHGTPPDPIPPHQADANAHVLAGDVTGPVGATVVERIRGVTVDGTPPADAQVLTFTGGVWRAADPAGGGVAPPAPGSAVAPETAFGLASNAGGAPEYSRADHTHGTPPDPIPPHQTDANAHVLAGDVTGPVGTTVVARIANAPVNPAAPTAPGQVLTFTGGQARWAAPAAVGGEFVEHPPGLPRYAIVAAGLVRGDTFATLPVYNGLIATVSGDPGIVEFRFDTYTFPDGSFQYIIKALLVANLELFQRSDMTAPVVLFDSFQDDHFRLMILVSPLIEVFDSTGEPIVDPATGDPVRLATRPTPVANVELRMQMEFMIEVSRFEAA